MKKMKEKNVKDLLDNKLEDFKKNFIDDLKKEYFSDNILERIIDFNDICEEAGTTEEKFMQKCKDDHLPDHEIALRQIELISEVLNESVELDYDNPNQAKYEPIFRGGATGFGFSCSYSTFTFTGTYIGSRFAYVSIEKSNFSGKTFTSIYKRAIIKKK